MLLRSWRGQEVPISPRALADHSAVSLQGILPAGLVIGALGVLADIGRRRVIRAPGLLAGYSLGRIGEELLRVDLAHDIFGLRLNFFVATALCLVGLGWFLAIQRPPDQSRRNIAARRCAPGRRRPDLPQRIRPRIAP